MIPKGFMRGMDMKPSSVNIFGREYKIEYVDRPSDVDIYKRESLWGQIDYWTRTIRIYDNGRNLEDIFETIIHEVLHGISEEMELGAFKDNGGHKELTILATALSDVLIRNKWIKLK